MIDNSGLFPDTDIVLALGQIVECDCPSNLYKVRPLVAAAGEPGEVWAIPSFSSVLQSGVQSQYKYRVGDFVLFIQAADPMFDTFLNLCVILCNYNALPPQAVNTKTNTRLAFNSDIEPLLNAVKSTLQVYSNRLPTALKNLKLYKGFGLNDSIPGEFTRIGESTGVVQSNNVIKLMAGKASLSLNALTGSIRETYLFKEKLAVNHSISYNILDNSTLNIERYTGNLISAFMGNAEGSAIKESWKPLYRTQRMYGDVLRGEHESAFMADGETAVYDGFKSYNGYLQQRSINGFKFIKDCSINVPTYVGNKYTTSDALRSLRKLSSNVVATPTVAESMKDTVYNQLHDDTAWKFSNTQIIEEPYSLLDNNEALYETKPVILNAVNDIAEIYPTKATFNMETDGSIVLRDGWGSELRMSHGNIQLFAAANIVLMSGRDTLNIAGGATTISSENVLSLESSMSSVNIKAESDLDLIGGNNTYDGVQIHAKGTKGLHLLGGDTATIQATNILMATKRDYTLSAIADTGSIILATKGSIHTEGTSVETIVRDSFAVINDLNCALILKDDCISVCSMCFKISGDIIAIDSKETLKSFTIVNDMLQLKERPLLFKSHPTLMCTGDVCTTGNVICDNDGWFGGNVAATMLAHTARSDAVGKVTKTTLNKATALYTKRLIKTCNIGLSAFITAPLAATVKILKALLKSKAWIFKHKTQSQACVIHMPLWCTKVSGRSRLENSVEGTYIYPGKNFWLSTGALTETGILYGVSAITVNSKNIVTE